MTHSAVVEGAGDPARRDTINVEIGERIHHLMWRRHMTQVEMASYMGVTQGAVSSKLRGRRPWFPGELLAAAAALDVTVAYLFGEATSPTSPSGPPRDDVCAGRESNPQPAGYGPLRLLAPVTAAGDDDLAVAA